MSIPDFERAEYTQPKVIDAYAVEQSRLSSGSFPLALLYGAAAAVAGSIAYSLVASLGFMISIVAIGVAWLIAKAMMTASRGVGGRQYQIAAVLLTYFAVSIGELLPILYKGHAPGGISAFGFLYVLLRYGLIMPFMELQDGFNGILGVFILFIGLRAAWRLAAGSPGFGGRSGPAMTPFGPR